MVRLPVDSQLAEKKEQYLTNVEDLFHGVHGTVLFSTNTVKDVGEEIPYMALLREEFICN